MSQDRINDAFKRARELKGKRLIDSHIIKTGVKSKLDDLLDFLEQEDKKGKQPPPASTAFEGEERGRDFVGTKGSSASQETIELVKDARDIIESYYLPEKGKYSLAEAERKIEKHSVVFLKEFIKKAEAGIFKSKAGPSSEQGKA